MNLLNGWVSCETIGCFFICMLSPKLVPELLSSICACSWWLCPQFPASRTSVHIVSSVLTAGILHHIYSLGSNLDHANIFIATICTWEDFAKKHTFRKIHFSPLKKMNPRKWHLITGLQHTTNLLWKILLCVPVNQLLLTNKWRHEYSECCIVREDCTLWFSFIVRNKRHTKAPKLFHVNNSFVLNRQKKATLMQST